jgi:hypothetical protein
MNARAPIIAALSMAAAASPLIAARDIEARHRISRLQGEVAAIRADLDHLTACEAVRIPVTFDAAGNIVLSAIPPTDRASIPVMREDCATRYVRPPFVRP